MDSDDGVYYESNDENHSDDEDDNLDGLDDLPSQQEKNYTVLSEADIRQLQEEEISKLSNVLSISKAHSCILLYHYKWDLNKVHDDWFANEENVRNTVGLFEHPTKMLAARKHTCKICFERYSHHKLSAASCGHLFCHGCWRGYIRTAINDGPGCLVLRCPEISCAASVDQNMVNALVSDKAKEKYSRYLLRSYIENSKMTKWCPSPGCDFAVKLDAGTLNYDVSCRCAHTFCWNCNEEAHRPVVCETVAKWIMKNNAESENMNWIIANSKPCPKCKRPIEKNHGCMHMTCRPPCNFEFCWLCLGAWSEHGREGYNACNRYETSKKQGLYDEGEARRLMAKNALERYTHYYERWSSNQKSRKKALEDLHNVRTEKLAKLWTKLNVHEAELKFISEAWEQIADCRRVLTWTYAYGYYLPEHENAKSRLFEYLQGGAESGLERLHVCTEKELEVVFATEGISGLSPEFFNFRSKLAGLTRVTRNYFDNLVEALENGLQEVTETSKSTQETSKSAQERSKPKRGKKRKANGVISEADYENWVCRSCTFINNRNTNICGACEHS